MAHALSFRYQYDSPEGAHYNEVGVLSSAGDQATVKCFGIPLTILMGIRKEPHPNPTFIQMYNEFLFNFSMSLTYH